MSALEHEITCNHFCVSVVNSDICSCAVNGSQLAISYFDFYHIFRKKTVNIYLMLKDKLYFLFSMKKKGNSKRENG